MEDGQISEVKRLSDLNFQILINVQGIVAMTLYVSTTVLPICKMLLYGCFLLPQSADKGWDQPININRWEILCQVRKVVVSQSQRRAESYRQQVNHGLHTKKTKMSNTFGFELLQKATSRQHILSYYRNLNIVTSLREQNVKLLEQDLFCINVTTGSGVERTSAFIYRLTQSEWLLVYKRPVLYGCVAFRFAPELGTKIKVTGKFEEYQKDKSIHYTERTVEVVDLHLQRHSVK